MKDMTAEILLKKYREALLFGKGDLIVIKAELLSRLKRGERAEEAMKQIGDLVYNNSCHVDTSNEVTRIFMAYDKEAGK
jgi:hypothetical protein